jgi:hypothetical protein
MAIKTQTLNKEVKEFPKIMVSTVGQIVLAIGPNEDKEGAMKIVMLDDNGYPINNTGYTEMFDSKSLKDYKGSITISNSFY